MKNLLLPITITLFLLTSITKLQAQDRSFGIKGGAAAYQISSDFGGVTSTSDPKIGFEAGFFGDFRISDILSIQLEAVYVRKGGEENDETLGAGSATLSYVDVPLLLKIKAPLDGTVKPYIFGGGFAGYLLDASSDGGGESQDITEFVEDINYGLKLGLGANIGRFLVDARYDMGLANLFTNDIAMGQAIDYKITTNGVVVTVGIVF